MQLVIVFCILLFSKVKGGRNWRSSVVVIVDVIILGIRKLYLSVKSISCRGIIYSVGSAIKPGSYIPSRGSRVCTITHPTYVKIILVGSIFSKDNLCITIEIVRRSLISSMRPFNVRNSTGKSNDRIRKLSVRITIQASSQREIISHRVVG